MTQVEIPEYKGTFKRAHGLCGGMRFNVHLVGALTTMAGWYAVAGRCI
jgi:hypothetical protein